MIKKLLCTGLLAVASMTAMADSDFLKTLFAEMPDTIIPYLTHNDRLDLMDFMDSDMKAEVNNNLGGKSQMTKLTPDTISIQLSEASKVDLYLMQLPAVAPIDSCTHAIMLVRTIGLEQEYTETETEFYSCRWRRLPPIIPCEPSVSEEQKEAKIIEFFKEKLNKN